MTRTGCCALAVVLTLRLPPTGTAIVFDRRPRR